MIAALLARLLLASLVAAAAIAAVQSFHVHDQADALAANIDGAL